MTATARWPALAAGLAMLAGLTGCGGAQLGWLATQMNPTVAVPAVYTPPKGKTVLVFVDDYFRVVTYDPVKEHLARQLSRQLQDNKVAKKTVGYERILALAEADNHFDDLSVSEVGDKLGADLVLYVLIDRFSLRDSDASQLWRGRLQATVRLVDVRSGRLWPQDRVEGYPVPAVETPLSDNSLPNYEAQLAQTLANQMAERVGRLFYDHKISQEEHQRMPDDVDPGTE